MAKRTDNEYTRAFQEAVLKAFAPLIAEYNLSLKHLESGNIELISEQCVLLVGRDYRDIGIGIRPIRADQVPKPRPGIPITCSLYEIIRYLNPDIQIQYGYFDTPAGMLPACELLAGYVRQYCKPMLGGDFSLWPKLLERRGKD